MKVMKCPECEVVSTFTHEWTGTTDYWAPLTVDNDGDIQVDYDNAYDEGVDDEDYDPVDECRCDKCDAIVFIDEIEIVEAEEQVPAE